MTSEESEQISPGEMVESFDDPTSEQGGMEDVPDELPSTLIELVATRTDEVIALIDSISGRILESSEARARFTIRMAWLAASVMAFIVIAAAVLTYLERIDGSTFGFLLGLVSGYMLNFVQDSMSRDPGAS